jgi:hypothetical protein
LKDGNHYQRIITLDGLYFIGATSTFSIFNDIQQHQELPPYLPQLLPLPGFQELPCNPPLDVIIQQDPLDVTDDHILPQLWDPMFIDYFANGITDLPPLLDDNDADSVDDN